MRDKTTGLTVDNEYLLKFRSQRLYNLSRSLKLVKVVNYVKQFHMQDVKCMDERSNHRGTYLETLLVYRISVNVQMIFGINKIDE